MSHYTGPRPIEPGDDTAAFHSGEPELDGWLASRALKAEHSQTARTYVVLDSETGAVAGYYCLSAHSVTRTDIGGGQLGRNAPDPVPVILLGRLAIDLDYQGAGLGSALLKDALLNALSTASVIGTRALLLHTINEDVAAFYLRFGFRPVPANPRTLFLPLDRLLE